jgi:hypothetical protein
MKPNTDKKMNSIRIRYFDWYTCIYEENHASKHKQRLKLSQGIGNSWSKTKW